jgi:hypothetical protein
MGDPGIWSGTRWEPVLFEIALTSRLNVGHNEEVSHL